MYWILHLHYYKIELFVHLENYLQEAGRAGRDREPIVDHHISGDPGLDVILDLRGIGRDRCIDLQADDRVGGDGAGPTSY